MITTQKGRRVTSIDEWSIGTNVRTVRRLVETWRYNGTTTYPGWLTGSAEVRAAMWSTREKASQILEVLPSLDPVGRLKALRELVWRWEIQLEPISVLEPTSSERDDAARNVLSHFDYQN